MKFKRLLIAIGLSFLLSSNAALATSTIVYPDASPETSTVDGRAWQSSAGATWASITGAAGNNAADSGTGFGEYGAGYQGVAGAWTILFRSIILFDVSGIGTDNVDSASLTVVGNFKLTTGGGTPSYNIYSSAPATNTAVVAGDFDSIGTTAYSDTPILHSSFDDAGNNVWTFNAAGITAIENAAAGDGILKIAIRETVYDVTGTEPATGSKCIAFDYIDRGTSSPKLTLEHSAAGFSNIKKVLNVTSSGATKMMGISAASFTKFMGVAK